MDAPFHFETQDPGTASCAAHCLNHLIQSPLFSLAELATIAQRLDALEAAQLDGGVLPNGGKGHNYDDSGFFSVGVVDEALRVYGLRLVAWASEEMRPYHKHPEHQMAFVLNHREHWFCVRKFANSSDHWYSLNSLETRPTHVSVRFRRDFASLIPQPLFLGMSIQQAAGEGYSIFAVVSEHEGLGSSLGESMLPQSEADLYFAQKLAETLSTSGFNSAASSSTTASKRRAHEVIDLDGDDEVEPVAGSSKRRRFSPGISEQSSDGGVSHRLRDTDIDPNSEEAQMRRAIEESLRAQRPPDMRSDASTSSGTPVVPQQNTSADMNDEPTVDDIFNSIASIVRAYLLPPSLDAAEIERASKLAQSTVDENRIAIFSKSHCPYCSRAKSLLQRELGQDCKILELDQRQDGYALQAAVAKLQSRDRVTVPQVYISGKLVGGNDALQAAHRNGSLAKMLAA